MENNSRRRTALGRKHSASRERILRDLELNGIATVGELAERTGLHENTVRGHLGALHHDGHVRQELAEYSGSRGRPTQRWSAVSAEAQHPYAGLALTLASALGATHFDPVAAARAAGVAWGEKLAADRAPFEGAGSARALITTIMREQGFAPQEHEHQHGHDADGHEIVLRKCPLLAAASERSDIVCAAHEGMIAGITGEHTPTGDSESNVTLLPFAADGNCVLRLQASPQPGTQPGTRPDTGAHA